MNKLFLLFLTTLLSVSLSSQSQPLKAFPTAEGFGKFASGGRGGKVVEVTNLNDSGEGSLRWALTEAGREHATIVFRVSGIITLEKDIRAKLYHVTIAGQTAPGDGILYRGGKLNLGGSKNVIMRNLRGRIGLRGDKDFIKGGSIGIENADTIIIDHCCFGWSGEENMTIYDNHFTTVQWCIVHEGLYNAGHQKGNRSYACQWGGSPASFHHNLLAHNFNRSARLNGATNHNQDRNVFMEYQNNVNYNWGKPNSCYGGENEAGEGSTHECNFVGNYYKPGPATPANSYFMQLSKARKGFELKDMQSSKTVYPSKFHPASNAFDYDVYKTPVESADKAYKRVLAKAGTIRRDAVEHRVVDEVKNGTARYRGTQGSAGFIDSPADAEGWPVYVQVAPVVDNDHDGMDDAWELKNGLDPNNPDDRNKVLSKEGYTALEVYLNGLMNE